MIAATRIPAPGAAVATAARAPLPVLTTARLTLRAPKLADFSDFARLMADPRLRYMGGPMNTQRAWYDFANYMACWILRGDGMFALHHNDGIIGYIFASCEPGDEAVELGYALHAFAEGQGFATEAGKAALDHLYASGHRGIVSYIDPDNTRSIQLAQRLGASHIRTNAPDTQVWEYPAPEGQT